MIIIRVFSAIVLLLDVCLKVVYLFKSRFASIELKKLYQMILILRPCLIGALI